MLFFKFAALLFLSAGADAGLQSRVFAAQNASELLKSGRARASHESSGEVVGINSDLCGVSCATMSHFLSKRSTDEEGEKPNLAIINGQDATQGQFPWQVSLQSNGYHTCGATIIDSCHLLTAAHCMSTDTGRLNEESANFKVLYGDIDYKSPNIKTAETDCRIKHAHFSYIPNDQAMVKIKGCFDLKSDPNVKPICVPNKDMVKKLGIKDTDPAVLSGFGVINEKTGESSHRLKFLTQRMIPGAQCEKQMGSSYYDKTTMICHEKSASGGCFGDSGGPLQVYHEDSGRWYQMGEVSWMQGKCGENKRPSTVYTSVPYYSDWIARAAAATPCDCSQQ